MAISADGKVAATGTIYFRGVAPAAAGLVRVFDLPWIEDPKSVVPHSHPG